MNMMWLVLNEKSISSLEIQLLGTHLIEDKQLAYKMKTISLTLMEIKNINYHQRDKAKQLVMELDQRREDWKIKKKELKFIVVVLISE